VSITIQVPVDLRNSPDANAAFEIVAGLVTPFAMWTFDPALASVVRGLVRIPAGLSSAPTAKLVLECMANATTGVVRMTSSTKIVDPANSLQTFSVAFVADTPQNVTVPATARANFRITFTLGELDNVVQADGGKVLLVEVKRESADGADTLAVDLELVDAVLEITVL